MRSVMERVQTSFGPMPSVMHSCEKNVFCLESRKNTEKNTGRLDLRKKHLFFSEIQEIQEVLEISKVQEIHEIQEILEILEIRKVQEILEILKVQEIQEILEIQKIQ